MIMYKYCIVFTTNRTNVSNISMNRYCWRQFIIIQVILRNNLFTRSSAEVHRCLQLVVRVPAVNDLTYDNMIKVSSNWPTPALRCDQPKKNVLSYCWYAWWSPWSQEKFAWSPNFFYGAFHEKWGLTVVILFRRQGTGREAMTYLRLFYPLKWKAP